MTAQLGEQPSVANTSNLTNPHDIEGFLLEEAPISYNTVHGSVTVHGAVSEFTLNVPTELRSDKVMIYINGFGAFKKTMRGIANSTAERGHANLRCSPIRSSEREWREDLEDATQVHVNHLEKIADVIADGAVLKGVPNGNEINIDNADLVPHSYGGDTAIRYALENPGSVNNLIMLMTVGMEDANLLRFAKRLPGFMQHELLPFLINRNRGLGLGDAAKAAKHFFSDPFQTIGEAKACHLADNRSHLYTLHAHNIGTALLSGSKDRLIPASEIEKAAAYIVDIYERLDVNHLGPQEEPGLVSDAVVRVARQLDELKKPDLQVAGQQ
jgi:pimeloyl-ACP methyl ester carboxylesterase